MVLHCNNGKTVLYSYRDVFEVSPLWRYFARDFEALDTVDFYYSANTRHVQ
jgi:hypothetical protein